MSAMTVFVLLALAATIFSLVSGISAMAVNGEVGHTTSNKWMFRRVGFQALTVGLLAAAALLG